MFNVHTLYGSVIVVLVLGVGYTLLGNKPKEKIVTQTIVKTEIKYVDRVVVQHDNVVVDRKITATAKDGTVVVTEEHSVDLSTNSSETRSQIKLAETATRTEVTKYQSNYTLQVLAPITDMYPVPNPLKMEVVGGVRVFNLPVFVNVGTNFQLTSYKIGLMIEL